MTFLVIGCSGGGAVQLYDPTIPEPLVKQLPLKFAVRYPDVFNNFVHEEQVIGKQKWSIDLGQSNRLLFTQLFSSMFTELTVIDSETDPGDLELDALIEPSIDAFEFSVPNQSQTDDFAVWIRYRLKIFDSEGVQIANWPIAAYGKRLTPTFGGNEALQRAAVLAMRDAAALIILQMGRATGINQLSQHRAAQEPETTTPVNVEMNVQSTAAEVQPNE